MLSSKKLSDIIVHLNFGRTLKLIWSLAPVLTALSYTLILVENGLFLTSAYIFKQLINTIPGIAAQGLHTIQPLYHHLVFSFVVGLCYVFTKSVSGYIIGLQGARVNEYIDDKIHKAANDLDLAFYESPEYFDTLKRAKDAGGDRPMSIVTTFIDVIKNVAMLLTLSYLIITIAWELIPLLAICIVPTFLVRISLAQKLHKKRLIQTPFERHASYLSSLMVGDASAKEIRGFGLGSYFRKKYLSIRMDLLGERMKIIRMGAINSIITDVIATIIFFVCVAYVCYKVINSTISVGGITLFLLIFPQLFMILQNLSSGLVKLYHDNIFLTYLFKLFDLKPVLFETDQPLAIPPDADIALEVKGIHFTYPHSNLPALMDINLVIPAGKMIAVVGLNGAGKTTLIKMLCRLYDPTEGVITLGGNDIRRYKSSDYRKCVSVVFQDFGKYNVSVAENIRFGDIDSNKPEEEIIKAAEKAGASGYIEMFPDKYETILGRLFENGREISIGQWQKLAIARALYSPSRFIILDEATSALDAKSEKYFFDSLRESIGKRGALIISHRLSAVQHADYIYVMADGRIKEEGTHEQLIEMGGDYAKLFKRVEKRLSEVTSL